MKRIIFIFAVIAAFSQGCKTTFATQNGDIVGHTPLGTKGYNLDYFIAVHTAAGQNDTASVYLLGPDSITNQYILDFKNYIEKKFPISK